MKKLVFLILAALLIFNVSILAQDSEQEVIDPFMEFSYWKNTDDQIVLKAKMTYFTDLTQPPLVGIEIKFYTNEDDPSYIGSSVTNEKGLAEFTVDPSQSIPVDMDGMMYFSAEYEGSDEINSAMEEAWAQDVKLDMILEQHEGVRQIHLSATAIIEGEMAPVADEDIYVFVPRMFSDLLVGEGYLEADGTAIIEFPEDIPGDSLGNIIIIARFDDHPQYGNVEKIESARWGVPSYHEGPGDVRTLWTQIAPKWMVITLSILLAGVWGHYIFAFISLIKIGKEGKSEKKNPE